MKDKDLLRAMSDIRDEYILEAAPDNLPSKVVPLWKRPAFKAVSGLVAACLVLVIGLSVYQINHFGSKDNAVNQQEYAIDMDADEAPATANEIVPADANKEAPAGAAEQAIADTFGEAAGMQENQISGNVTAPAMKSEAESEAVTEEESETETENK